jgi:DNA-binding SARP family transcriptional activator
VARLCGRALKARLDPDLVRDLIRYSEIAPPDPDDEAWPWPLRITTFGGLTVALEGEPLTFSRKTPKRLIALLKAIVAYGGSNVPEEKLIDAVWPDEEGDAGHSAITVAIHRLRKLLGDPAAILVKGGRVSLSPARCWLDLWSFQRRLARRDASETEEGFRQRVERALSLYQGDFLAGDDDLWWAIECRDRMRDAYLRGCRVLAGSTG